MSKSKRELSGEERALWRRVAKTVKQRQAKSETGVPDNEPIAPAVIGSAPRPASITPRAKQAPPPSDRGRERRVRRGKLDIGATLDLHGHTQASGRAALGRFLQAAFARGDRTVIVVTGVGRSGGGVLKARLPQWLAEQDIRGMVAGFALAHRSHGGAGAYYVFLKKLAAE